MLPVPLKVTLLWACFIGSMFLMPYAVEHSTRALILAVIACGGIGDLAALYTLACIRECPLSDLSKDKEVYEVNALRHKLG